MPSPAPPPRVATSGRHSVAMGKGLSGGVAGQAAMFQVQCKDANGQNRTQGGDVVEAKLVSTRGLSASSVDCHVIDNLDGSYTCTYLPTQALRDVDVMVAINGTRLSGVPFKASFEPGTTEATNCRAFGESLCHGVTGKPQAFHVVARDAYSNVRTQGGDKFHVHVQSVSSFHPEHTAYMKKWQTEAALADREDGSYEVQWSTNFPGWYSVSVTLDRVPICDSPFRVCILAASVRKPDGIVHRPVFASDTTTADAMPPMVTKAECAVAGDVLVVRKPVDRRAPRVAKHDIFHFFKTGDRRWAVHEMKGPLLPDSTAFAAVDDLVFMFAQSDEAAPIDAVYVTDLDMLRTSGELRRRQVDVRGQPPTATSGFEIAATRQGLGCATFWFVGGKATTRLSDVYGFDTAAAEWTCYHSSSGGPRAAGNAVMAREHHSVVAFHDSLWIFGGKTEGGLQADLHVLDTGLGVVEWKEAEATGRLPAPRECHTAVVVEPTGYMLVIGGLDESGTLHEEVMVLNMFGVVWARLDQGVVPRHSVACACVRGEIFTFGGLDAKGNAFDTLTSVDVTTFLQRGCMDLNADPTQYVCIKSQGGAIGSLRQEFTVEAWVLARSFPPHACIISKSDNGWKTGFGLAKYGAGKGDLEEVPYVNFWLTPGYATTKVQAQIEPYVWTHIAGTYNGQQLRIVVNGTVHDTLEFKAEKEEEIDALHYHKADFCIGAHPNKSAWDGMIDEVRVWNVCRTDAQIRETMHSPIVGLTPGLAGQWTFNEGAGDLCVDSSGMRNHGTIENGATRVPSTRTDRVSVNRPLNEAEKRVEDAVTTFTNWKTNFEKGARRKPTRADMLLAPANITAIARQLGEFDPKPPAQGQAPEHQAATAGATAAA